MYRKLLISLAIGQFLVAVLAAIGVATQSAVESWIVQAIAVADVVSILLLLAVVGSQPIKLRLQRLFDLIFGTSITSRLLIILLIAVSKVAIATIVSRNAYLVPTMLVYLPLIVILPYLGIGPVTRIVH